MFVIGSICYNKHHCWNHLYSSNKINGIKNYLMFAKMMTNKA